MAPHSPARGGWGALSSTRRGSLGHGSRPRYLAGMGVSPMPRRDNGGPSEPVPAAEIYKVAVEEYRFQATYNWTRTRDLLVFNSGVLAAGAAVASRPGALAALVFAVGAVASTLAIAVVRTQQKYYRAARDRMRRVEVAVGIPEGQRTDTTTTLGGRSDRKVSVMQVVYVLFAALALAHSVGVGVVLAR